MAKKPTVDEKLATEQLAEVQKFKDLHGKNKTDVFKEAMEANPNARGNTPIENWVIEKYPDFPWGNASGTSQISAARSSIKKSGIATVGASTGGVITPHEITISRDLAETLGGPEKVLAVIAALDKTDPARLKATLEKWDEMVEAAGGNLEIAERFLSLMGK